MVQTNDSLENKRLALHGVLARYQKLAIAFSGGVDSTLLLAVARQQLGDDIVAMTARSPVNSTFERTQAADLARRIGVRHIEFTADLMADADFRANGPKRCYYCKRRLFSAMQRAAEKIGYTHMVHGANADDCHDYRPGSRAADEMGVAAPLSEAGLTKADIRRLARRMKLPNWNRPAMACLATRLPYGVPIEAGVLLTIEKAEKIIRELGITQCRVRVHTSIARIEVGVEEVEKILARRIRQRIVDDFRALGFRHVCLDMEGYVSGKMNRDLPR